MDNWISSRELSRLLTASSLGNRGARFLQERLAKGLIAGRSRHAQLKAGGLAAARRGFHDVIQRVDWEVPATVWSGDVTNSRLDLTADKFTTRASKTGYSSVEMIGLSFDRSDVAMALPELFGNERSSSHPVTISPRAPKGRGGGRPPSKADWSNFAAALAVVAARDEVDVAEPGRSAASVYNKAIEVIQIHLGADQSHISIDSVTDTITKAQEWLRSGMPKN